MLPLPPMQIGLGAGRVLFVLAQRIPQVFVNARLRPSRAQRGYVIPLMRPVVQNLRITRRMPPRA